MAFIFSTSHLPETRVRRPEDDEEEEVMQPMPRAFRHLPEPRPLADTSGPLSTRPAIPVGRTRPYVDPEADAGTDEDRDTDHAPGPDSDHDYDDAPRAHDAYANDAPWHSPRITAQDLPQQSHGEDEDAPDPRSARDAGFDDMSPAGRSASRYPDTGSFHRPQDIRSDFHSPSAPDSSAWGRPAAQNRADLARGLPFEERSAQEALAIQQKQGKGGGGPSSQQRSLASQRAIAAPQPQARDSSPPAQDGRLIAQQPAPPLPPEQAPRQSGPTMPKNQGPDAAKQGAGATPAKDGKHPLTVLCEKFAEFPKVVEALIKLYRVPTGRRMIEKLATVADKIHAIQTTGKGAYVDNAGMHLKKDKDDDISPDTLGHELQHLGEILFNTPNPFLKVEDPNDLTAYPGSAPFAKEFRAMRIQNQLLLERYQMMQVPPILVPFYYDDKTRFPIPGSLLPWD